MLIYDCEIKKAIAKKDEERLPDIEYCLNDVVLTKQLLDLILSGSEILDPRNPDNALRVQPPQ